LLDISDRAPARSVTSRITQAGKNLGLLLLGLVLALVVLEIAFRVVQFGFQTFIVYDDQVGFALQPGAEGWLSVENHNYVKINSQGQYDREHALKKPPNTLRIAVLGDSMTEAAQVPIEDGFASVMERELANCPAAGGKEVEAINFGVHGYSTAQELLTLRSRASAYQPDVVLLAVFTGNDIFENSRALRQSPIVPYFVLRDGMLVEDDSFRERADLQRKRSNPFNNWLDQNVRVVQAQNYLRFWIATYASGDTEGGDLGGVYREPTDPDWKEAWNVTDDLIALTYKVARQSGAQFLLVTLSNPPQVSPNPSEQRAFAERVGVSDLLYPERHFAALAQRDGIPYLALAPIFQKYAEDHNANLHGFGLRLGKGHWNQAGHRLAGQMMARSVCAELAGA
jgi:lysophospholipase L1-like esterase